MCFCPLGSVQTLVVTVKNNTKVVFFPSASVITLISSAEMFPRAGKSPKDSPGGHNSQGGRQPGHVGAKTH